MVNQKRVGCAIAGTICGLALALSAPPARAAEVWVTATYQQDLGGLGVASDTFWPVTPIGAVRLAWAIPNDLQTFQSAKVALIPHAADASSTLNIFVCPAQNGDPVAGACAGPFTQAFTGVANKLVEVEIGSLIASVIGTAGSNYLAVLAFTSPTTTTDQIVGLRFAYVAKTPTGVATLGANTFTGTQTAPAFAGDGSGLTNLPFPAGAATLGANVFTGTQTAPFFVGNGSGLTNLPIPPGVATLNANTFTGTQTIHAGNLDLDASTATAGNITKGGTLFVHTFGANNLFVGVNAGNTTTSSLGQNVGVGAQALRANTTGIANTATGYQALLSNSSGGLNTATGWLALGSVSTASFNTGHGANALSIDTTGASNTALGYSALSSNTGGHFNLALGASAGINATTGSNNIYLGSVAGTAGEANTMYLGQVGTQMKTLIAGVRGVTTGTNDAIPVMIDSTGQLGTASSSIRFKEDIHDMAGASQRLLKLRPVTFRYSQPYADGARPMQYGLIAEEVAEVFPELAVRGADGRVETVHYETLNVLLVNELQKQQQRIEALEKKLDELVSGLAK